MKKTIYTLAILFSTLLITSCSIQLNLAYNANESGKLGIKMKSENNELIKTAMSTMVKDSSFSQLKDMNLMDSLPAMENMILPEVAASLFGFKNPEIKDTEDGKEVSFEFNDINSLNGNQKKRDKSKMFFKKSKNSLTIYMPKETESMMGDDNENSNFSGMFANMIQTELKLQFERKVKKSNFKKIAFSDDKKTATIRLSIADFKELKGKKITFQFEK